MILSKMKFMKKVGYPFYIN